MKIEFWLEFYMYLQVFLFWSFFVTKQFYDNIHSVIQILTMSKWSMDMGRRGEKSGIQRNIWYSHEYFQFLKRWNFLFFHLRFRRSDKYFATWHYSCHTKVNDTIGYVKGLSSLSGVDSEQIAADWPCILYLQIGAHMPTGYSGFYLQHWYFLWDLHTPSSMWWV